MANTEKTITIKINGKPAAGSLADLEKEAKKLNAIIKNLNPETDKEKIAVIKKQYDEVNQKIRDVRESLGLVRKSQKEVAEASNDVANGFRQIMTAAFWLELIQQVADLTKEFFALRGEIGAVSTEIAKMTNTSGDELDALTAKVRGMAKAFGVEATEINAAANSISKNLKVSFEEALRLVQNGLASSAETEKGELLQYYNEYASALSDANLQADKFVQIISKQKELGVWDDKAIDAIKEFSIIATTDLAKFEKGLKSLEQASGETFANKLIKDIDSGAVSIDEALNKVSNILQKLPADSVIVKQAISELFGAMGEDVGAGFFQNLTKITSESQETSASLKAYQTEINNLVEAEEAAAQSQKEFIDSFGGTSKSLEILGAKGTEMFFDFMTSIVQNSKPLVDFFKNIGGDLATFGKNIFNIGKNLGFFSENSFTSEKAFGILVTLIKTTLMPFRAVTGAITYLSTKFSELTEKSMLFRGAMILATGYIRVVIGLVMELYGVYEKATNALDRFFTSSEQLAKREAEDAKVIENAKDELVNKYDELKKKRAEELIAAEEEGKKKKELSDKESQALTELRKKQADEAKKRAEERKKEAEEQRLQMQKRREYVQAIQGLNDLVKKSSEELTKNLLKDNKTTEKSLLDGLEQTKKIKEERLKIESLKAETRLGTSENKLSDLEKTKNEGVSRIKVLQDIFSAEWDLRYIDYQEKLTAAENNAELMAAITENYNAQELQLEKEHKDALINEEIRLATAKATIAAQTFGTLRDSTEAIKTLFGEQTEAAKIAGAAMKVFGIGEITANAILEISNIWKNASANPINALIPGAGYAIAGVETAGVIARKAKAIAEISGVQFRKGGLLKGRSHEEGGIKGIGAFSNIEVEGGEFIVNKQATSRYLPLLQNINTKFQTGGVLPSPNPVNINYGAMSPIFDINPLLNEMSAMLDELSRIKKIPVVLSMNEFEDTLERKRMIENY